MGTLNLIQASKNVKSCKSIVIVLQIKFIKLKVIDLMTKKMN